VETADKFSVFEDDFVILWFGDIQELLDLLNKFSFDILGECDSRLGKKYFEKWEGLH